MPAVDTARGRLLLSAAHQLALADLWNGRPPADPQAHATAVAELTPAGIVDGRHDLHPLAADLARVAAEPHLSMAVEVLCEQGYTLADVIVHNEVVWSSHPWPGNETGEVEYQREDLPQLLWTMARMIGLHRAQPPADARPWSAPLGAVTAAIAAFAGASDPQRPGWDTARTATIAKLDDLAPGLDDDSRKQFIATLASIESNFRITCIWGPAGLEPIPARGLAGLYCGDRGYWVREAPAEPLRESDIAHDTTVTFAPTSAGDLWRRLSGLLPSSAELAATRASVAQSGGERS